MNLRRIFHLLGSLLILWAGIGLSAAEPAPAKQLYTCGMHQQIIRDKPGDCPICGMKLTPIRANAVPDGERKIKYYKSTMNPGEVSDKPGKDSMGMEMEPVYTDATASAGAQIHIDAATIQRMNLKTAVIETGPVRRQIRAVGSIEFDESSLHDIATKYEGWLEKLHVDTTWTAVKAGDPLFDIYSPELYNAELNYLLALHSEGAGGGPLTRAATGRLRLYDIGDDVLSELKTHDAPQHTYTFRAPTDGIVIEKMGVQGQMMKPGEVIYKFADVSTVWVLAQIYESDLPFVQAGQHAEIHVTFGPDRIFHGDVALVLPEVSATTRTAIARIIVENPDGFLRPGMFADVRLTSQIADNAVLVPDSAVLRTGEHNTVFIAQKGGMFEPREVRLGARTEDYRYEVLSGITAGERVVISGQFMLDSESQLREAIEKMLHANEPAAAKNSPPAPAAEMEHTP